MGLATTAQKPRLFAVAGFLLAGVLAFGQTFGAIGGEARDASGAAIVGANVTAVNAGTNASRMVITNEAGDYNFPSLPPGTYLIRVESRASKR